MAIAFQCNCLSLLLPSIAIAFYCYCLLLVLPSVGIGLYWYCLLLVLGFISIASVANEKLRHLLLLVDMYNICTQGGILR